MSAENGNRYAEKWTYESTMSALDRIAFFAMQEDTLYLGMALARAGYYDDIWRYWRKKWARNFAITNEMKQLMQHFEARIYGQTAKGKIPLRLGIFTLQHHYGWGKEPQGQEKLSYLAEADKVPLPETETVNESNKEEVGAAIAEATLATAGEAALIESQPEQVATSTARPAQKKYPTELTPEELEMETGISDIREIERRMREEDPELAEFDDMDEDMEWEVVTPETYKV